MYPSVHRLLPVKDLELPVIPEEEPVNEKREQERNDDLRDDDMQEIIAELHFRPDKEAEKVNVQIIQELIDRAEKQRKCCI